MFKVQSSGFTEPKPGTWNAELVTRNPQQRQRGFTLFELAVVIAIYGVLAAVLLDRLAYYKEMAEKAAMESMVRVIKTGLQVRLAELIIANRQGEAAALETANPMQWLESPPANYGGVYRDPPAPGTWYFDAGARELVYVVNTGNRLDLDTGQDAKQVRFRARLVRDRLQAGGVVVESVTAVTLIPVYPYRWR